MRSRVSHWYASDPTGNRVLATVLAIRLVSPVRQTARLGDRAWHERINKLREAATQVFSRYDGQLGTIGPEEIIGRFDGPARAMRCGLALQDVARSLGLDLAAGVQ